MPAPRPDRSTLYRDAVRASLLGLMVNALLGVVKLIGGIVGHSFALVTDVFTASLPRPGGPGQGGGRPTYPQGAIGLAHSVTVRQIRRRR